MTSVWMNSMNVKMPHRMSIICMPAGGKARSVPAFRTNSMKIYQPSRDVCRLLFKDAPGKESGRRECLQHGIPSRGVQQIHVMYLTTLGLQFQRRMQQARNCKNEGLIATVNYTSKAHYSARAARRAKT